MATRQADSSAAPLTRTCKRCGAQFVVRAEAQRYCNVRCYAMAKGALVEPPPRRTR